jgi:hypothetical protein
MPISILIDRVSQRILNTSTQHTSLNNKRRYFIIQISAFRPMNKSKIPCSSCIYVKCNYSIASRPSNIATCNNVPNHSQEPPYRISPEWVILNTLSRVLPLKIISSEKLWSPRIVFTFSGLIFVCPFSSLAFQLILSLEGVPLGLSSLLSLLLSVFSAQYPKCTSFFPFSFIWLGGFDLIKVQISTSWCTLMSCHTLRVGGLDKSRDPVLYWLPRRRGQHLPPDSILWLRQKG